MKKPVFLFPLSILQIFFFWYGRFLAHPSFFIDESYYIGAARAIASGDWLLRSYAFDKFFLQAWLPSLGVFLFGENPLGYRVAAFVAWGLGIFVWRALFRDIFRSTRNSETAAFFWTGALYLNPFMAAYAVSPMAESFLLLFFGIFAKSLLDFQRTGREVDKERGFLFAALAIATKQNALLWLPNVALFFAPGEWRTQAGLFWRRTRWVWFLAFLFLLAGPIKFAPIAMALGGLGAGTKNATFLSFLETWIRNFFSAGNGLGVLALVPIVASLVPRLRDPLCARDRSRVVFLGALAAHVAILVVASAQPFPRYIFILFPQVAVLSALSLVSLRLPSWAKVTYGACGLVCVFASPRGPLIADPEWGRSLAALRFELAENAVVHTPNPWYVLADARPGQERISCVREDCIRQRRIGQPLLKDQWVVRTEEEDHKIRLERTPFVVGEGCRTDREDRVIPVAADELIERLLGRIRLAGSAEIENLKMQGTDFEARLLLKKEILGLRVLTLHGALALRPERFDERGDRRVAWGVRVTGAEVGAVDLTDALTLLWNSSWLELGILPWPERSLERFEALRFTQDRALFLETTHATCAESHRDP